MIKPEPAELFRRFGRIVKQFVSKIKQNLTSKNVKTIGAGVLAVAMIAVVVPNLPETQRTTAAPADVEAQISNATEDALAQDVARQMDQNLNRSAADNTDLANDAALSPSYAANANAPDSKKAMLQASIEEAQNTVGTTTAPTTEAPAALAAPATTAAPSTQAAAPTQAATTSAATAPAATTPAATEAPTSQPAANTEAAAAEGSTSATTPAPTTAATTPAPTPVPTTTAAPTPAPTTAAYSHPNGNPEYLYSLRSLQYNGVIYWRGYKFTYYSQSVLPGRGLSIPGRHVNADGYVSDGDGYIVLANSAPNGTIIPTPFGYWGKVYDSGTYGSHFDVYTR